MKSKSGFTIIEVLVTAVVIAIVSSLIVLSYSKIQSDSRDSTRKNTATLVSNALEKYYNKNGEYPSVRSLVNNYPENTGDALATKLRLPSVTLTMPNMPADATNILTAGPTPHDDYIAYIGKSDVNDSACQTSATGGCDQFTLKYLTEAGDTITIDSDHRGRPANLPTSSLPRPVLTVTRSGSSITATASTTTCGSSAPTAMYTFRTSTNNGSWSSYSTWSTTKTLTITGAPGSTYSFQGVTRCDNGSTAGTPSPESDVVDYTYPIDTPTAPTTTVTTSGSDVTGTSGATTCQSGTTVQYAIRNKPNNGVWSDFSAWSATPPSVTLGGGAEGKRFDFQSKARCIAGSASSSDSIGAAASYTYPISTPAAPTVTVTTSGTRSTWTWNTTACPAGTTAAYATDYAADWGYDSGWSNSYTNYTSDYWDTTDQGYQYTVYVSTYCYNSNAVSSWSPDGSASYIRPIMAPGAASGFYGVLASDRMSFKWSWTEPTCPDWNHPEMSTDMYVNGSSTSTWYWTDTGKSGWHGYWAQGWYTPSWSVTQSGSPIPSGGSTQVRVKYICVNNDTGRTSAWGPVATGPLQGT